MKKSLIISSILLLGVAMSAAPSSSLGLKGKLELLKKNRGSSLPAINLVKREGTCTAISCAEPGSQCTVESSYCQAGTRCFDGECRMNAAGDPCKEDGECDGEFRCDSSTSKCVARLGVGESCTYDECETTLSCSNGVCTQGPSKAGDECISMFGFSNCPLGLKCSDEKVCVVPPGVGEACTETVGCSAGLICDPTESICKEAPKAGEPCIDGECSASSSTDLYCDDSNVCRKLKGLGESCSGPDECDSDYYECGTDGKCKKYDTGGSCTSEYDCDGPQACFNGVCTEIFTLDEGAECPYTEPGTSMGEAEMFLCKDGLGCVPNRDTGSGYVCKKIDTKFSDNLPCESDSDCPADSACKCNSATGAMQCYPYMVSSQETLNIFVEYSEASMGILEGNVDLKKIEKLALEIAGLSDPNSPDVRCYQSLFDDSSFTEASSEVPPEPAVSSSVVPPHEPSSSSGKHASETSTSSGKHTSETSTSSGKHASETSTSFEVPVESSTPASDHPAKASSSIDDSPSFAGQAFVMPLIYLVAVAVMFL